MEELRGRLLEFVILDPSLDRHSALRVVVLPLYIYLFRNLATLQRVCLPGRLYYKRSFWSLQTHTHTHSYGALR